MVEKRVKKIGQGPPPPPFGQLPKENIFFSGGLPLDFMLKMPENHFSSYFIFPRFTAQMEFPFHLY